MAVIDTVYNVLILGPSQSGKSTFVENLKKYINPEYTMRETGGGNCSHTTELTPTTVTTSLPPYGFFDEYDREIELSKITKRNVYHRHIDDDIYRSTRPVFDSNSRNYTFNILDTPGLNDTTQGNDIANIANIFTRLQELDITHFNLVIVTDSHHVPMYVSQKQAFETYFKLFDDMKSRIVVVHTHVDDMKRFHSMDKRLDQKLNERAWFFAKLTGKSVPTVRIDCDPENTAAVQVAIRMNTIRDILKMALVHAPVVFQRTAVSMLPVMVSSAEIVHKKYQEKKDLTRASIALGRRQELTVRIAGINQEIMGLEEKIERHDTDDEVQLDQVRYEGKAERFGFFGKIGDQFDYYFGTYEECDLKLPQQPHILTCIRKDNEKVDILSEEGGIGETYWKARIKRLYTRNAHLHVTACTAKRILHKSDIAHWRETVNDRKNLLASYQRDLESLENESDIDNTADSCHDLSGQMNVLIDRMRKYQKILDYTASQTLPLVDFLDLAKSKRIKGISAIEDADALEEYLRVKFDLVELEN
ncbi:hypothetical protein BGW42_000114 [Actinomortierella wolfii]|nr:hypothetical protein BGW42_000114 [Actinomortierella wolfii]